MDAAHVDYEVEKEFPSNHFAVKADHVINCSHTTVSMTYQNQTHDSIYCAANNKYFAR